LANRHLPDRYEMSDGTDMERNDSPPIRLLLVDDDDVALSRSVARLDQDPDLQIVGDARDSTEALKLVRELQPDAVLVETRRQDRRGLHAIARLSSLDEEIRPAIVAYLEIVHRDDWPRARAAGADDVVLQEMPASTLAGELRRIVVRARGHMGAIDSSTR
jgi:DNA-binding NarL/FixJ family response regulator